MDKARVLREIAIDSILPAHFQPRQAFPDEAIDELAASMKEVGQNTPLVVRPVAPPSGTADSKERFKLVCGECRLRAAQRLGWTTLWAVIEELTDEEAAVRGMVDNEQRRSLNPIERAVGYQRLINEYKLSQERVCERTRTDRATLSRLLSLLEEPTEIQELLKKGSLTVFHCRSLDRIADRKKRVRLAREAAQSGMSAKETDKRVQKLIGGGSKKPTTSKKKGPADLATDYSGFRFWWEEDKVGMRMRELRLSDSVRQYLIDFPLALEGFLRNEPHPTQTLGELPPEAAAMLADAAIANEPVTSDAQKMAAPNVAPEFAAEAAQAVESLKPFGDIIEGLAKAFGGVGSPKK